ncbi:MULTISPECIES: crotonase/enoyl-CoA hydratase family protein [Rhodobacterales]|jgi:methylglutaconyl-CoA hydratase|uniref:crotonase/enoyl-CoA hydratase family protein n=1 Tax=Rhodobacterales TaxID=204455 RepID=UPI00064E10C7|nr:MULTISPECIES: crotonase/enoyl-CoA hydratase family protein [Alphaproteobacteria]KMK64326.1 enoyl-CoA hydratase/carnithine racemase [Puniceibacterium sp. IMCC21224]MCZ4256293.1 crotonase/enoyl-CoA hydratase family protein [Sulfitobacter sp. G21635-S1]OZB16028.1 MAG: enoyl-CoA hydratase [Hyphomonas sp. 34-62-18]UOA29557.1 putative enoyl-CoA hydratase echA8 [Pseudosulfitobacter sp. DSM 107133]|tara:strand:- start:5689 stop:6483 length:795 start_codon:yes stop_codon:yes gene_type:complete
MTTSYETIIVETDARGVATVTLNRPDKHNALNADLIAELFDAVEDLASDDKVRIVILTGAGKSFCAGGDFNWFASNVEKSRAERVEQSATLAHLLRRLDTLQKPLIGRINGPAYGGGVGMISVCDYTIGAEGARYGLTEVKLGLLPANISPYVVARIGKVHARETMLSGALFDSARAERIGLLTEVVAADALDAAVERVVHDHLQAAPGAVADTKALIAYVASHDLETNMIYTADRLADAWETGEGIEGINSFLNKSVPSWRVK